MDAEIIGVLILAFSVLVGVIAAILVKLQAATKYRKAWDAFASYFIEWNKISYVPEFWHVRNILHHVAQQCGVPHDIPDPKQEESK